MKNMIDEKGGSSVTAHLGSLLLSSNIKQEKNETLPKLSPLRRFEQANLQASTCYFTRHQEEARTWYLQMCMTASNGQSKWYLPCTLRNSLQKNPWKYKMLKFSFKYESKIYTILAHITQQRPLRSEAKHPRSAMAVWTGLVPCFTMFRLISLCFVCKFRCSHIDCQLLFIKRIKLDCPISPLTYT